MLPMSDAIDIVAANNKGAVAHIPDAIAEADETEADAVDVDAEAADEPEVAAVDNEPAPAATAEEEEPEDVASSSSDEEDFQPPAISDQLKVGKHSGDRATNTDSSEIRPLNELTASLLALRARAAELKREFGLISGYLQAQLEEEIRGRAVSLQAHMNEQINRLERSYVKQLDRARMAHRAELDEAVIKVHRMYDAGFGKKQPANSSNQEPKPSQQGQTLSPAAARKLRNRVLELEAHVSDLQAEVNRLNEALAATDAELADANQRQQAQSAELHLQQQMMAQLPKVQKEQQQPAQPKIDVEELERRASRLEKELAKADQLTDRLTAEKTAAQDEAARFREEAEKLQSALDAKVEAWAAVTEQLEAERQRAGAGVAEAIAEAAAEARAAALAEAAAEAERERQEADERLAAVRRSVAELQSTLEAERRTNAERMEQLKDVEKLRRNEEDLRRQVSRLRAEAKKSDQAWEKKFAVLKRSLHAVKDECFVRQTAQRQAAVLHQASVMYAADAPGAILAPLPMQAPLQQQQQQQQQQQSNSDVADQHQQLLISGRQQQLPRRKGSGGGGGGGGKGFHERRADLLSYTASAPNSAGVGGGGFQNDDADEDENQVCSEGEELPKGVATLPERIDSGRR